MDATTLWMYPITPPATPSAHDPARRELHGRLQPTCGAPRARVPCSLCRDRHRPETDRDGSARTGNKGARIRHFRRRSAPASNVTPHSGRYGRKSRVVAAAPAQEPQTGAVGLGWRLPPGAWRNESPSPPLLNPGHPGYAVAKKADAADALLPG